MTDEIKTVKSKIAKLLALGSSSNLAESGVAMKKAQQLLNEWALTIDDIDLGGDDIVYRTIDTGGKNAPELSSILMSLSEFTNLKLWVKPATRYNKKSTYIINMVGYEQDVEIFEYFWGVVNKVFESEYENYKNSEEYENFNKVYHGRAIRKGYVKGFTNKVNATLDKLTGENEYVVTRSGTALVPLKNGKVDDYFDKNFDFKLRRRKSYTRNRTNAGFSAGNRAGANVSFNSAVGGSSSDGVKLLA